MDDTPIREAAAPGANEPVTHHFETLVDETAKIVERDGEGASLPMTEAENNAAYLTNQRIVDLKSGRSWALNDYGKPKIDIPPGELDRLLRIERIPNGMRLIYARRPRYAHEIYFNEGEDLLGSVQDNEGAFLALKNRLLLSLEKGTLHHLLFKHHVPVWVRGFAKVAEGAPEPTNIRMIRRRPNKLDFTAIAQETELRRTRDFLDRAIPLAMTDTVSRMEADLDLVRYVPYHESLEGQFKTEADGDIVLVSGDSSENELIVSRTPRDAYGTDWELQPQVLLADHRLVDPNAKVAIQAHIDEQKAVAKGADEYVSDVQRTANLLQMGYAEAVASIPDDALTSISARGAKIKATDGRRDRFTQKEHQDDEAYFKEAVQAARRVADANADSPTWWRRLRFNSSEFWKSADFGGKMDRLARFLSRNKKTIAYGAAAVAGEEVLFDQRGSAAGVAIINKLLHGVTRAMPVYSDANYATGLWTKSIPIQGALPLVILVTAGMASRKSQFNGSVLAALTGIRTYARIFQANPFGWAAGATGQRPLLAALQEGETFPLLPPSIPILGMREARDRISAEASQRKAAKRLRERVANFMACAAVGVERKIDVGELFLADKGQTISTQVGLEQAIEVRHQILGELKRLDPQQLSKIIAEDPEGFLELIHKYRARAAKLGASGEVRPLTERFKQQLDHIVRMELIRRLVSLNQATEDELRNAIPSQFTADLIRRDYQVDYWLSLIVAASVGQWADPSKPELLHYQNNPPLFTLNQASTENANQSGIHYMRGAASEHMVFTEEISQANVAHRPVEDIEWKEHEKLRVLDFKTEAMMLAKTVANFRRTQPFQNMATVVIKTRVKLAWSTFLMGMAPRMLLGGQSLQEAAVGQSLFMILALWTFGWPWSFVKTAMNVHDQDIRAPYDHFRELRIELSQAVRLGDAEAAESLIAQVQEYAKKGPLEVEAPRPRGVEEGALDYGTYLIAHYLDHNPFPARPRSLLAYGITTLAGGLTGYLGTYLFANTFIKARTLGLMGVNWTDWNIVSGIPEGDGLISLAVKSAVGVVALIGIQRTLNFAVDKFKEVRLRWKLAAAKTEAEAAPLYEKLKKLRNDDSLAGPKPEEKIQEEITDTKVAIDNLEKDLKKDAVLLKDWTPVRWARAGLRAAHWTTHQGALSFLKSRYYQLLENAKWLDPEGTSPEVDKHYAKVRAELDRIKDETVKIRASYGQKGFRALLSGIKTCAQALAGGSPSL